MWNDWNADRNQGVFFNFFILCYLCRGEFCWKISTDTFWRQMQSEHIMRKEVQAICYSKYWHPCKQWDLPRGNCLVHCVDFSVGQSNLCHVDWTCDICSGAYCVWTDSHLSRTLDHTLLLYMLLRPSMLRPSGGLGDKSPRLVPRCAILEGQGSAHFLHARKKLFYYLSTYLTMDRRDENENQSIKHTAAPTW